MPMQEVADFWLPCGHAVVVIFQILHGACGYVDKYYHKTNYQKTYKESIIPFVHSSLDAGGVTIDPPNHQPRCGKSKKKRIPSRGEVIPRKMRYGRCGQVGNQNKKSCNRTAQWSFTCSYPTNLNNVFGNLSTFRTIELFWG